MSQAEAGRRRVLSPSPDKGGSLGLRPGRRRERPCGLPGPFKRTAKTRGKTAMQCVQGLEAQAVPTPGGFVLPRLQTAASPEWPH